MIHVQKVSPKDWQQLSADAHLAVFEKIRPSEMERISYALFATEKDLPLGYATVRELDSESVYWQYGGGFPGTRESAKAYHTYRRFIEWTRAQGIKRISTYVSNENIRYLRLAFHFGFRVIGVRMFGGEVFVELLNELGGDKCGQL